MGANGPTNISSLPPLCRLIIWIPKSAPVSRGGDVCIGNLAKIYDFQRRRLLGGHQNHSQELSWLDKNNIAKENNFGSPFEKGVDWISQFGRRIQLTQHSLENLALDPSIIEMNSIQVRKRKPFSNWFKPHHQKQYIQQIHQQSAQSFSDLNRA